MRSASTKFRQALKNETPLQLIGTVNAYVAMLAKKAGFNACYLSGGALAAVSYGLPDLGITTLDDVLTDAKRITNAVDLPLMVDIDTGFGSAFNIERTIQQMIKTGVAAVHMEDQITAKRCGHRPNKKIVSTAEMCDRLKIAINAKTDPDFFIMARTDAVANEGIDAAIARAKAYVDVGADGIFAEAITSLADYEKFCKNVSVPILANMTEFGKSPLFTREQLTAVGIQIILYPLTITRAMNQTAVNNLKILREQGSQQSFVEQMQTREALYDVLNYHDYEKRLDELCQTS